jgi:hypothetical protein
MILRAIFGRDPDLKDWFAEARRALPGKSLMDKEVRALLRLPLLICQFSHGIFRILKGQTSRAHHRFSRAYLFRGRHRISTYSESQTPASGGWISGDTECTGPGKRRGGILRRAGFQLLRMGQPPCVQSGRRVSPFVSQSGSAGLRARRAGYLLARQRELLSGDITRSTLSVP